MIVSKAVARRCPKFYALVHVEAVSLAKNSEFNCCTDTSPTLTETTLGGAELISGPQTSQQEGSFPQNWWGVGVHSLKNGTKKEVSLV